MPDRRLWDRREESRDDPTVPFCIPCTACGSEGRIYRATSRYDDQGPIIADEGPCDVCDGTGREVVEDSRPIALEDLDAAATGIEAGGQDAQRLGAKPEEPGPKGSPDTLPHPTPTA